MYALDHLPVLGCGWKAKVWTLESYRRLGWDDQHILVSFPTLRQADLTYTWLYVEANRAEIEEAIREHEAA